jgi:GTPase involved in cell partitioning and DNA repair
MSAFFAVTTLKPQIGTITFEDLRQITIADLPGLIEGAHENAGLGHRFLKHIERTQILLLMIDINGFRLGHKYPHRTPLETLALLNKELELYGRNILSKPAVLLINKMDTEGAEEKWQKLEPLIRRFNGNEFLELINYQILTNFFFRVGAISARKVPTRTGDELRRRHKVVRAKRCSGCQTAGTENSPIIRRSGGT